MNLYRAREKDDQWASIVQIKLKRNKRRRQLEESCRRHKNKITFERKVKSKNIGNIVTLILFGGKTSGLYWPLLLH